jgi:predicted O-methyltransferase YrrM
MPLPSQPGMAEKTGKINMNKPFSDDTEQLIDYCFKQTPAGQDEWEMKCLVEYIRIKTIKTVIELGVYKGGTLSIWAMISANDAHIIGIDNNLEALNHPGIARGQQVIHYIYGDTLAMHTLKELKDILGETRADFLFIDGCHMYGGVKNDYEVYSPLVANDGIIAFHDINNNPDVRTYWNEVRLKYKTSIEFINPEYSREGKIEPSFGIGVVCQGDLK